MIRTPTSKVLQTIDDFSVGRTLGKGVSSIVRRARRAGDKQEYALKIFVLEEPYHSIANECIIEVMENEVKVLKAC